MKKLNYLLVTAMFLLCTNMALAVPIWFDADGSGVAYQAVRMTELSGSIDGRYNTYQDLGGDGILGNGDTFLHDDPLYLLFNQAEFNDAPIKINPTTQDPNSIYAMNKLVIEITAIGGKVVNYNDGPDVDPTSMANPSAILDDSYSTIYTPYQGDFNFYWDPTNDQVFGDASLIGNFKLVAGGGDVVSRDNSTLTADLGFDMLATIINPGFFFLDDNGSQGLDVSTWMAMNSENHFFWALADFSVNISGFTAGNSNDIVLDSGDNGIDVEFGPAVVPEPATMFLFGIGLLGMGVVSRKKFLK